MNITKLNIQDLEHKPTKYINKTITQFDNKKWMEEIQKKTSLTIYSKHKLNIREEQKII